MTDVLGQVKILEEAAMSAAKVDGATKVIDGRTVFNYSTIAGIQAAQADLDSYRFKKCNWETNITLEGGPLSLPWGLIIGKRQMNIDEARNRLVELGDER